MPDTPASPDLGGLSSAEAAQRLTRFGPNAADTEPPRTLLHRLLDMAREPGFMLLVAAVGLGLGQLFEQFPPLYTALRYAGAAYLLYLAWKIDASGAPDADGKATGKPFTFFQAAAFQWVNPKAWIMAIGAITTYTPQEGFLVNVLLIAALFALVNCPSVGLWTVAGSLLRRWLDRPRVLRAFNIGMALLLVASLYPILIDVKGSL